MDDRVSTSFWRPEGISFFPTVTKPFKTRGSIVPISNCLPCHCQHGLSQRRERGAKTNIFHKLSIPRSRREIPPNGKARFHISNCGPKAQAILPGTYCDHPNRQAYSKSNEQPWSHWTDDTMGDWVERIRHTVPTTYGYKRTSYCWLHYIIHPRERLGGRRDSLIEHPHERIF